MYGQCFGRTGCGCIDDLFALSGRKIRFGHIEIRVISHGIIQLAIGLIHSKPCGMHPADKRLGTGAVQSRTDDNTQVIIGDVQIACCRIHRYRPGCAC
ncbi:hypothetical protein D3C86_1762670 [compost metagenome]